MANPDMARVINQTKGTVVAQQLRVASSLWSRLWGLMGRKELPAGQALYLPSTSSIHTAFMRFPIDVVFLSEGGEVRKVAKAMKPFRLAAAKGVKGALELPAGTAARGQVEPGDRLVFTNNG